MTARKEERGRYVGLGTNGVGTMSMSGARKARLWIGGDGLHDVYRSLCLG